MDNITSTLRLLAAALLPAALLAACSSNRKAAAPESEAVSVPAFDADSAYRYVAEQVAFGPRVPNTPAHRACGDYIAGRLAACGARVSSQRAGLTACDGTLLKARNIIGSFRPEARKRIALFAHWDCRPWADQDPDPKRRRTPVPGANDGASGVGVLLEIARLLKQQPAGLGIDIILLDAEDYGAHNDYAGPHEEEAWCLGAQYWARNPHAQGYNARFGILLDMVGGKNATFRYEGVSEENARHVNRKVWRAAERLGYGQYFERQPGGYATDDHLFINRYARIPTIDIIAYSEEHGFFEHWHTLRDDMDAIDRNTLKAVGQTVADVIYNER